MSLANATLTDSADTIFTASGTNGSAVILVTFQNDDVAEQFVTLHACPANEAGSAENRVFNVAIPSGDSYLFDGKLLLANGDSLRASCENTGTVGVTISYEDRNS